MEYQAIIISGVSGTGKSTIARTLCEQQTIFQIVQAVTTRKSRQDDRAGEYQYIDEKEFRNLDQQDALLIKSEYRKEYYGITHKAFRQVIENNKIPILILTPKSVRELETQQYTKQNGSQSKFFTIFLDASDDVLNNRLIQRGHRIDETIELQRRKDRACHEICLYTITNIDTHKTVELLRSMWEYRKTGGVLPKRLIQLMIESGVLLENADVQNITGAAYDLSLGDEYYYGGKIKTLTDKEPFILIEPYDYAIVTSKEIAYFPKDIIGRFGLSVSLFCQGIILSNGPQVDPGFRGRLFCLLFNTSNASVFLKRGQHYATFEFHKLIEPTTPYLGKYQGKEKIVYYLPSNTMRGAINELKKELETFRRESRNLQAIFLGVISLILAIIAILLVIR
jgi:deoxycytidine triphosphate deaminase